MIIIIIIIIITIIITTDFNRSDITLIDRENKTAVVVNIAVPLTYNLFQYIDRENHEIWKSKISGSLTYLYTPQPSQRKEWSAKNS